LSVPTVLVTGSFDNLRSRHVRFLEEASKLGDLHVLLWSDDIIRARTGQPPKFPQEERRYLVEAIRFVKRVTLGDRPEGVSETLRVSPMPDIWAVDEADDTPARRAFCAAHDITYHVFTAADLSGFPEESGVRGRESGGIAASPDHRATPSPCHRVTVSPCHRVIVTGCYDWLHSGHVRFFEEASTYGDLIVAAGNDANVRNLKGEGHPLQTQAERRYMIAAIRYVALAVVTSGWGWLDAEPEIIRFKPDIYLVNEDGDKPEKRAYCATHGLQYVVLKRTPKEGLPRRSSTDLRGF
jgi:cytidyltransferase-like protein